MRAWREPLSNESFDRFQTHLIMARMSALPGYDCTVMDAAWKGVSTRRHAVSTNCAPKQPRLAGHQDCIEPA